MVKLASGLKSFAKGAAPAIYALARDRRQRRIMAAFEAALPSSSLLSYADLERMNARFPSTRDYGYDPASLQARGEERAKTILDQFPLGAGAQILEVGCWDAMVSAALGARAHRCTAVDMTDAGFDPRAAAAGVALRRMDATRLDFPDDTFDLAFSFNAFEHFPDAAATFAEMVRVVRPGGFVYVDFGPLFMSANGLHGYYSVNVPYCQFLFAEDDLQRFAERHKKPRIEFETLNRLRPDQFRAIFAATNLAILFYRESRNPAIPLMAEYAGLFKRVSSSFDDFLVSSIEAGFRKKTPGSNL